MKVKEHGLLRCWTCRNCWVGRTVLLLSALFVLGLIGLIVARAGEPKPPKNLRTYTGTLMDNPIPPGHDTPRIPRRSDYVANRKGYTVHFVEQTGTPIMSVAVPFHDMSRASWENRYKTESTLEQEVLVSIRNTVTIMGTAKGKSDAWIENTRKEIKFATPVLALFTPSNPEGLRNAPRCVPESDGLMSITTQYAPECGGSGGGGCNTCVCASSIYVGGKPIGCGGGCGDCYVCTVCG